MRVILGLAVVAAAAPAHADSIDEPPATFHQGQVGFSARLGLGFRGIAPRNDMLYCGVTDSTARYGYAPVCTGREPLAIDLEAAYGVAQHIELLFELRVGLEKDFGATPGTDGPRPLSIAPGARFFFSEAKHTKLFVQPMVLVDLASYQTTAGNRGTEWGLRGLEGYWIDFHRTYGMYVFIGESAQFSPWLQAEFEGGVGIQGRYP
jgi:hypothetical protein